jgi:hypothetical protein
MNESQKTSLAAAILAGAMSAYHLKWQDEQMPLRPTEARNAADTTFYFEPLTGKLVKVSGNK